MPELPEVETIRAGLDPHVRGRTITRAHVWHPRIARTSESPHALEQALTGLQIESTARRGKFMWAVAQKGQREPRAIVMHLGMSGQLHWHEPAAAPLARKRHEHVRLEFDDGSVLSFVDQRTFGRVEVVPLLVTQQGDRVPTSAAHIARDPLDPLLDLAAVSRRIRASRTPIKTLLLNQAVVSGVGNIYADEALWATQIFGGRRGRALRVRDVSAVLEACREVIERSIAAGGTSFDTLYVNIEGQAGYFERELQVYGREGQNCRRCGAVIRRIVISNRSHFYCPHCQRGRLIRG
ncbi:bifunctional DNA-formamidopyrimidine glycosylase/DNA-(apurinic or apyrimidinic site) lyase [Gleimia hominis]|uniref:Formamidopyrimidine-DNA glycosylase n=1 Tax=Gleimia hominis TaxID=595468 RepID=A0ABU3IF73_9ACTO|nr:bifunctional DNA-formamidopyrimidine glycosylase/DNA-(apurinic or apyrimidinic site) lyase [Gleimia hominis]MDT3768127.1 bifunctional DNA-formamidopyrimidine glycosylase/DNA-(apurinic or apyrimidinic site) lyase [Gleimia hominis]